MELQPFSISGNTHSALYFNSLRISWAISNQVTHIVVRKGVLFTEDKIVPPGLIAAANEERVSLREGAHKLDELTAFEETHYIPLDEADLRSVDYPEDMVSAMYWYPIGTSLRAPSL